MPQFFSIGETQLCERVRDVILDRVNADPPAFRDLFARQAMLDGVHRPPFGGSQHIVVRGSTGAGSAGHEPCYAVAGAISLPLASRRPDLGSVNLTIPGWPRVRDVDRCEYSFGSVRSLTETVSSSP